jgi:hypothetical protein
LPRPWRFHRGSMYGKETKTELETVRSRSAWWKKRIEVSQSVMKSRLLSSVF